MKSPKQPELKHSPGETGNQLLRMVQVVRDLKLWRILLFLILLTIIFFIISIWLKGTDPKQFTWLRVIPWESLATTTLGVAMIGFIFEWVVRKESNQELHAVLIEHFHNQASELHHQIPKAMLTTPEIMRSVLAPDVVDSVILASLEIRLEDTQLAREAYDSFLSHLLNYEERRKNYRCNVYLTNAQSKDIPAVLAQKYCDGYIDVRYDTRLQKDAFRFTCVATMEEYEELLKDPTWELRWIAEPTKDYSSEVAFQVESVHVNGLKLHIRTENTNERQVIIADHLGLQSMQETQVTIHYRYKVKIKKRGHLLMVHVPCPTHNFVVELDYAHTDIDFVNVLDFFTSKTKPNIRYIPTRQKCHKIEVELNDWVFPKGGVVFVWVLRAEKHPNFWRLSTDPRRFSRPSKPDQRATNPLLPLSTEKEDNPGEPSS